MNHTFNPHDKVTVSLNSGEYEGEVKTWFSDKSGLWYVVMITGHEHLKEVRVKEYQITKTGE